MVTKHIAYVPRPGYELLRSTGLLRYPQCVRETVTVMVPRKLLAWLPFIGQVKVRVLMPAITVN